MKKLIFFLLIPILYAQQGVEISGFGGAGLCNIWARQFPLDTTDFTYGFNGGISAQYNFDEINTVRLEVGYYQKGYIAQSRKPFNYVTISPLMQFHVSPKIRWYFICGPYFGVRVSPNPLLETFDIGLHLGTGYKQNLWKKKLFVFLEFKDQFGVINCATKGNGSILNHSLNGLLGISWRF